MPATACSGSDGTGGEDLPVYAFDGTPGPETMFEHGVASGDPLADAVILWTRVSTGSSDPQEVFFEMATDAAFENRVAAGFFATDAERDFTVKMDVDGLEPGTTYYYRFKAVGRTSAVGRTRTAPAGSVDRLRFGVVSCSSYPHGYFHGYRELAGRLDLDVILHLGDYIYEFPTLTYGNVRPSEPETEILSLDDYRTRYKQYRRDADLQAIHHQFPMIAIWDDHESTDNSYKDGANNHQPDEGDWTERKRISAQVYSEYMPIRDQPDGRIFRSFKYGELVDLIMLDTRIWGRDAQIEDMMSPELASPSRQLLGGDQEMWFVDQLKSSRAKWRIVGQQIMVGQFNILGAPFNTDAWDGYSASRDRFFATLSDNQIDNVVVLTGDFHTTWGMDLSTDPNDTAVYDPATGSGSLAVEFVTPGITSPGIDDELAMNVIDLVRAENPHVKTVDLTKRGILILDITPARVQGAWFHAADVTDPDNRTLTFAGAQSVADGANHLVEDAAAAPAPTKFPPGAPT